MEKSYRIGHMERELSVTKDGAGLHVTVDGKQYTVTDSSLVEVPAAQGMAPRSISHPKTESRILEV